MVECRRWIKPMLLYLKTDKMADKEPRQVRPTKGRQRKPGCFNTGSVCNDCIRCAWIEMCLYLAHVDQIEAFKEQLPEDYDRIRNNIMGTTSFED